MVPLHMCLFLCIEVKFKQVLTKKFFYFSQTYQMDKHEAFLAHKIINLQNCLTFIRCTCKIYMYNKFEIHYNVQTEKEGTKYLIGNTAFNNFIYTVSNKYDIF